MFFTPLCDFVSFVVENLGPYLQLRKKRKPFLCALCG
jgi:hypothetical protein